MAQYGKLVAVTITALALGSACGDNLPIPCESRPAYDLPEFQRLVDTTNWDFCVPGGLVDLPGRWFLRSPPALFDFSYPLFEGTCDEGFTRDTLRSEFDELGNFDVTWSDGTRYVERFRSVFSFNPGELYEREYSFTVCLSADGQLLGNWQYYNTDYGLSGAKVLGDRFALRDEPAKGLVKLSQLTQNSRGRQLIPYNLVVMDDLVYAAGPRSLTVIRVENSGTMLALSDVTGEFNDVKVVDDGQHRVAFLSSASSTQVVDVTDPSTPEVLAALAEYSHSVFVEHRDNGDQWLYLATYGDTVPVYDVTNPLVPVRLGEVVIGAEGGGVHDIFSQGDQLFVNDTTSGLVVFDIAAGLANAVELGRIPTSYSHAAWAGSVNGRKIIIHGDEGMTPSEGGAFLRILDGDTQSPNFLGELARYQSRLEVGVHNIQLVGNLLYVAYYQDGVRVLDLSDPTAPVEVAHYNTWDPISAPGDSFEGAIGVRVADGKVYVADTEQGIIVLQPTL